MANPNDEIRDKILRHLYEVHRRARGPRGVAVGIRELQSAMRGEGIRQADVNSNLDYLIQKGWVREVIEERTFQMPRGTTQQAPRVTYKISDVGIDRLEAASVYRREELFSRINVTNVRGVTVIGTGNIVNTQLTDLSNALSELELAVAESTALSEEDKLTVMADLATMQSQLAKPRPDGGLILRIWRGIETVVTAVGLAQLVARVNDLIRQVSN